MDLSLAQRRIVGGAVGVVGLCLLVSLFTRGGAKGPEVVSPETPADSRVAGSEVASPSTIAVHVIGAVQSPGVYCLAGGARLQDAVLAAGGFTSSADTQALNLAAALADGMQIGVPYLQATQQPQYPDPVTYASAPPAQAPAEAGMPSSPLGTSVGQVPTAPQPQPQPQLPPVGPAANRAPATTPAAAPSAQAPANTWYPASTTLGQVRPSVPAPAATGTRPQARRAQPQIEARYPVSLNRASQQELEVLPYVGPSLAQKIVAYRQRFGPFRRLEDLLAVQGIGPRTLQRIAPYVSL